jgi:DNA-binding Xre family transcriptional regulator
MPHKELKKTLIDQGMTIKDLAQEAGYTRVHMSNIVNGHIQSIRAEKLISFILGRPRDTLFKSDSRQD